MFAVKSVGGEYQIKDRTCRGNESWRRESRFVRSMEQTILPTELREKWAVVGGGILGMTIAMRLAQAGREVTLIEAADHLGGLADAWQLGGITWDRHYHVTLMSDEFTRGILRELNLDDDMQWVETRTGFFSDGQLHSMSNSLEFLLFPPLSLFSKLRLGLTIFAASKINDWKKLEKMHVEDWFKDLVRESHLGKNLATASTIQTG